MSVCILSVVSAAILLLSPAVAGAHSARSDSQPQPGARLDSAPSQVRVEYTEPPTGDSVFQVLDGCNRDVVESFEILNGVITARLGEGEPGDWTVSWQVISAVDGHATKDQLTFSVRGTPDCDRPAPTFAAGRQRPAAGSEGTSPFVPIALASVAIVGLAVVARMVLR